MQVNKLKHAILILLFVLVSCRSFGQTDVGSLNVAIRDKASEAIVPAMICITSLADNTWRIPPDGRLPAPYVPGALCS